MEETVTKYKKISFCCGLVSSVKIFEGGDHFLFAVSGGYTEDYFRFFFSDIQAVKLIEKQYFGVYISIAAAITGILLILSLVIDSMFLLGVSVILLLLILIYVWRGSGTKIALMTALGDKDYIFCRKRKALKMYKRMCDIVNESQGVTEPAEVVAEMIETERTVVL